MTDKILTAEDHFNAFINFNKSLMDPEWYNLLKTYILSSDFKDNLTTIIENLLKNETRFTPGLKHIFEAFYKCKYKNTKIVLLGQDPYPQSGIADGLAFSCSNSVQPQPSLRYIFKAINKTVYKQDGEEWRLFNPGLHRWAAQGILLLNTALTVEMRKPGSHVNYWKNFTAFFIDMLSRHNPDIIWILLGKNAEEYLDLFPLENTPPIVMASHPASAAYNKAKEWDCKDIFNKVNEHLQKQGKDPIIW